MSGTERETREERETVIDRHRQSRRVPGKGLKSTTNNDEAQQSTEWKINRTRWLAFPFRKNQRN